MAYATEDAVRWIIDTTVDNILAFAAGTPQNVASLHRQVTPQSHLSESNGPADAVARPTVSGERLPLLRPERWDLIERKRLDLKPCHKYCRTLRARTSPRSPMTSYAFSAEARGIVEAPAEVVFAYLDDQENLSSHMSKPSAMMLGTKMRIFMEPDHTKRVGSRFGFTGSVLGVPLNVDEVVTSRTPPSSKTWETTEEPTLWIMGRYGMGFEVIPQGSRSELRVYIGYRRPTGILGGLLGWLFGPIYARWCTGIMVDDAVKHFGHAAAEQA